MSAPDNSRRQARASNDNGSPPQDPPPRPPNERAEAPGGSEKIPIDGIALFRVLGGMCTNAEARRLVLEQVRLEHVTSIAGCLGAAEAKAHGAIYSAAAQAESLGLAPGLDALVRLGADRELTRTLIEGHGDGANIAFDVRCVLDDATTVATSRAIADAVETMRRPGRELGELREKVRSAYEILEREGGKRRPTLADRIAKLGSPEPRLKTGFEGLDRALRGGARFGKRIFLQGPPSSLKTALVVQLARTFAEGGTPVAVLVCDDDVDDMLVRIGQMFGIDRDSLERGAPSAREALDARLHGMPLEFFDGEEDTLEDAADVMRRSYPGRRFVLAVDSIQTCRVAAHAAKDAPDGKRGVVDAVVAAMKAETKRGTLVLATCEVGRAVYRSDKDSIEPMAAGKESGGIEYAAHTTLLLRSRKSGDGVVDAVLPKNRGGLKLELAFKLDPQTCVVSEVVEADDSPFFGGKAAKEAHFEECKRALVETVRLHQPVTRENVFTLTKGFRSQTKREALAAIEDKLVKYETRGRKHLYSVVEGAEGTGA